jgi:glycosyltransferase involved in cell wall biosynthesis
MAEPLVSIIVPTYNRAALLAEALASVRAQTFGDWECIVVDDGSTDGTAALLATLDERRFRIVRSEHSGNPAHARNAGLADARGRYLAFLDDDDLWKPGKLAAQVPLLTNGSFRWSFTGFVKVDSAGALTWQTTPDWIRGGFILEPLLENEVGGFDEAARTREDYAMWLDLAARAEVVTTPQHLTIVRDHPGRIFRPEAYRFGVALYRKWLGSLRDPALRRVCRRRIAETYLTEGRRQANTGKRILALVAMLRAMPWDLPHVTERVLRALRRRVLGPLP